MERHMFPLSADEITVSRRQLQFLVDSVDFTLPLGPFYEGWTLHTPPPKGPSRRISPYVWLVHFIKYALHVERRVDWFLLDQWSCGQVTRAFLDYKEFCRYRRPRNFSNLRCYSSVDVLWFALHLALDLQIPSRPRLPDNLQSSLCPFFSVHRVYTVFLQRYPPYLLSDGFPFRRRAFDNIVGNASRAKRRRDSSAAPAPTAVTPKRATVSVAGFLAEAPSTSTTANIGLDTRYSPSCGSGSSSP